jgi:hypothetical protein
MSYLMMLFKELGVKPLNSYCNKTNTEFAHPVLALTVDKLSAAG